jgi:ABC-2 type transport system permease protein
VSAGAPRPLRTVGLIARREFLSRVRGRAFIVSTVVILVVLVGYALFVSSLGSPSSDARTVTVAPETAALVPALRAVAADQGRAVTVEPVPDAAAGRQRVLAGDADAALSGAPGRPTVDVDESLPDDLGAVLAPASARVAQEQALAARGIDPTVLATAAAGSAPVVVAARPEDPAQGLRIGLGAFGAFLLFFSIQTYGGMVAQGVVEEKASRVVELVLATVRPWQLLLGKVLGLGAVGLLQLVVLGAVGLAVAGAAGLLVAGVGLVGTLVSVLAWYLLGFTMYATIYAALGSLVSRQEDTQSVLTPVSIVVLIGWVAGFNLVLSSPHSPALTVLSLLPPWAPLTMPARVALGGVPVWQVVLAFALTIAFTGGVLLLGGRIYSRSVLRTGARVSLRSALRD